MRQKKDLLSPAQLQLQAASPELFLDAAAHGIAILHVDGTVLRVNPAFTEIFRYSKGELEGQYLDELIVPVEKLAEARDFRQAALRGPHVSITTQRRRSDGSLIDVSISAAPVNAGQGTIGTIFFYRDITDQRTLDQQLLEAQKMEAIGRLVGNVSHDFNNLLTAIMVYCGLLTENLGAHDAARAHAEEIYAAAEQGSELVRQLLSIARQRKLEPALISLSEIVEDLETMLRRLIGENIQLEIKTGARNLYAELDPNHMQQAILNLALNARDAMPSGGRLIIKTSAADLSADKAGLPPGEYVLLSVEDTGIGMDEATRARVFEPFFSTKPQGKGPVSDSPPYTLSSPRPAATFASQAARARAAVSICTSPAPPRSLRSTTAQTDPKRSPASLDRKQSFSSRTRIACAPESPKPSRMVGTKSFRRAMLKKRLNSVSATTNRSTCFLPTWSCPVSAVTSWPSGSC